MKKISHNVAVHIVLVLPLLICFSIFAYQNYSTINQNNCNTTYSKTLYVAYLLSAIVVLCTAIHDVLKWSRKPHFKQVGPVFLSVLAVIATVVVVSVASVILLGLAIFCIPF